MIIRWLLTLLLLLSFAAQNSAASLSLSKTAPATSTSEINSHKQTPCHSSATAEQQTQACQDCTETTSEAACQHDGDCYECASCPTQATNTLLSNSLILADIQAQIARIPTAATQPTRKLATRLLRPPRSH